MSEMDPQSLTWHGRVVRWARVGYRPEPQSEADPVELLTQAWKESQATDRISAGQRVLIALGSRAVSNLPLLVAELIGLLRERGADVELIPAMGSHGGGTPEGQVETLHKLGFGSLGVPIIGWDETSSLGQTADGRSIPLATIALERADYLIPVNRIKQHTSFRGSLESGLCKMIVIGLGGTPGARMAHRNGPSGIAPHVEAAVTPILEAAPIPFALGLIEGPDGGTASVHLVRPDELISTEKQLLERARRLHPKLPFAELDVLIADRMGKDISGTGLDTHVIGRWGIGGLPPMNGPQVNRIGVLALSEASGGNANGIGMVDAITTQLYKSIDYHSLRVNTLATSFLERGRIPLHFGTQREVIEACLRGANVPDDRAPKLIRIDSTKHLSELFVSHSFSSEIAGHVELEQLSPWEPVGFDGAGQLIHRFATSRK